jgi:hypothetical protein
MPTEVAIRIFEDDGGRLSCAPLPVDLDLELLRPDSYDAHCPRCARGRLMKPAARRTSVRLYGAAR